MSCGSPSSTLLARNQELRSAQDGSAKTYWGPVVPYTEAAIYIRAVLLYVSNATIRIRGRSSIDGATWLDSNPTGAPATNGYIDGLSTGRSALGAWAVQYVGTPDEHTQFFQVGIEVTGTSVQGGVTLSADAAFGPVQVQQVDLTPQLAALTAVTAPTLVPNADTFMTRGFRKVRVQMAFSAAINQALTLYVATGPTAATATYVDLQTKVATGATATDTTMSFVVENVDDFCNVYYFVGATTGAVSALRVTLIP